jgi:hypothetical protein
VRALSRLDNIPRLRLFAAPVPCAVYEWPVRTSRASSGQEFLPDFGMWDDATFFHSLEAGRDLLPDVDRYITSSHVA